MPPTFEKLLAELIERAASSDDPISREFQDRDIAHLKRWLDNGGANKTWNKMAKGPFHSGDAFAFVRLVLDLRRWAEEADLLNKEIATLKRDEKHAAHKARSRAVRKLRNNGITPQQYAALRQRIEEVLQRKFFDPLLSNRSDKNGARKRTIFCRVLSDVLKDVTGKLHDAAVKELCEIAFNCGDVTIDMVRSARRESTRTRKRRR
jgi:hypothetical protein